MCAPKWCAGMNAPWLTCHPDYRQLLYKLLCSNSRINFSISEKLGDLGLNKYSCIIIWNAVVTAAIFLHLRWQRMKYSPWKAFLHFLIELYDTLCPKWCCSLSAARIVWGPLFLLWYLGCLAPLHVLLNAKQHSKFSDGHTPEKVHTCSMDLQ